jgi:hypothetical protein
MGRFPLESSRPFRLELASKGPHRFGGPPAHDGVLPRRSRVPLHLLLLLDLRDADCPFKAGDEKVRYLPLYFPLRYGQGGPTIQYAVRSDQQIEILALSDASPDPDDEQYVRVPELPQSAAQLIPLEYEEARVVNFASTYFRPNRDDLAILERLHRKHPLILIGGGRRLPQNAGDVICENPECEYYKRRVWFDFIASIPPVPVDGSDDFWHEYQGGSFAFYFGLCPYCRTVIASTVAE